MTTEPLMVLAALLFVKHLFADGPLQTRYQLRHKGDFLHPGGLLHTFIHVALTVFCFVLWFAYYDLGIDRAALLLLTAIVVFEFVTHYMADWLKVQADRRFKWSTVRVAEDGSVTVEIHSSAYFVAFLTDQTVHSLTYVAIVYLVGMGL